MAQLSMYGTASKSKHAAVVSERGVPIDYRTEDFTLRVRELTGEGDGDESAIQRIGDCRQPAPIANAVYAGHKAARELGAPQPSAPRDRALV